MRLGCVIVNYGYYEYVKGAFYSALGAGYRYIVVVDNFKGWEYEKERERLESWARNTVRNHKNYKFIFASTNYGIAGGRNVGIDWLLGYFGVTHFTWLDADDYFLLHPIPKLNNDTIIYGNAIIYNTQLKTLMVWNAESYEKGKLLHHNYIPSCSTIIPAKVYEEIGELDKKADGAEDWDYWIRAELAGFNFKKIDEIMYVRRVHGHNAENTITENAMKYVKEKHKL